MKSINTDANLRDLKEELDEEAYLVNISIVFCTPYLNDTYT